MALAAFRYASSSVADSVWASAMLSKLALTGSSGSQSPGVDLQVQQVANGLRVLGTVEALERAASGIRGQRGGLVQAPLQGLGQVEQRRGVGAAGSRRGHHAGPQLADHPLGDVGVPGRVPDVEALQRQVAAQRAIVVAERAGALDDVVGLGVRPAGLCGLGLQRGAGHAEQNADDDGNLYLHLLRNSLTRMQARDKRIQHTSLPRPVLGFKPRIAAGEPPFATGR